MFLNHPPSPLNNLFIYQWFSLFVLDFSLHPPKNENLLNIFHFLYLRVIIGFVSIGWMMLTLDETVIEKKKLRKKTKTSKTIPKFTSKIDLGRTRKFICQI